MSGPFNLPEPDSGSSAEASAETEAPDDAPRIRHDGFTEAKKSAFLKALVKTGCVAEACRRTGISRRTIYRHQDKDEGFLNHCATALRMSATPLEITAWQRAVEGIEEQVVVGGRIMYRTRYSEGLLRLLLQGSNPKKFGPRPGFKRKRLLKHERKEMEREIRAEIRSGMVANNQQVREALVKGLKAFGVRVHAEDKAEEAERLAGGWSRTEDGHWVPPGYGPLGSAPAGEAEGDGDPRDSM